jgi:regulator of protease activity HflC (stomatin/prohibitin superfamily)
MFEVLINHIISFIDEIVPWFTIKEYESSIILRFGKYHRSKGKGIHLKIPFIDKVLSEHIVYTTLSIPVQSLITKDNNAIVVKGIVKYKIDDVKLFLLEVYDAVDAISDTTQAIIASECNKREWADMLGESIDNDITKKLRVQLKRWGIYVDNVTLSDKSLSKSFRLFNETQLSS